MKSCKIQHTNSASVQNRRLAALFLALCLTMPFASACGENAAETTSDTTKTPAATDVPEETETTAEPVETRVMHEVPQKNFDGGTFHSYALDWQGYQFYFYADETTGDSMNDAIYDRTLLIEDYLNVDMTYSREPDYNVQLANVRNQVKTGDNTYQEVLLHCIYGVSNLSSEGYLYNYESLPYVNLSADWWNQTQMDVLRLGERTYFGVSDYMIPCPYVVFVNRDMIRNRGMEDPYQLVNEKRWTLDRCLDMAASVINDENGDGQYTEEDIWGMSANEISKYISFVTGSGQFMTEVGEDGHIYLAMNTEKMFSIIEKLHGLANLPGGIYLPKSLNDIDQLDFDAGRVLFYLTPVSDVVKFRHFETDIGMVPYPLYNEEQENYISLDWGGLQCVPGSLENPELVGAVLELQAYYSADTVIPAYYDVLLDGKIARDEETVKMLDIIFDTIAYEVGGNYFGFSGGFTDLFFTAGRLVIEQKSTDFASFYARNKTIAEKTISRFYTLLDKFEKQ